ncbi:MAG: acyl carrier protein [Burkholderiaceae bacterium]|nr:acyl carrier protein [Burkholderiaceae bacterium]
MTNDRQALTATVLGILRTIAPEVEPGALEPTRPLRHQVDLDSMDWLNFLVALHERLGVNIPEADYAQLATLDNLLDYLLARRGPASV